MKKYRGGGDASFYKDDNDFIILDLFYGSLHEEVIQQFHATHVSEVFGIIGGLLGLWVCFALKKNEP